MTDTVVDKLLQDAIASNDTKIREYYTQIELIKNQIAILSKESKEYVAEYQKNCPHPEKKKYKTGYMAGGYDHVSETEYEIRCIRCEKLFDSIKIHGTYA